MVSLLQLLAGLPYKRSVDFCKYILLLSFVFLLYNNVFAEEYFDAKGKDFWLTFLPNYHNNYTSGNILSDSVYIYITSATPTSGTITYFAINGQKYTHVFNITNPNNVYTFKENACEVELLGYNSSLNIESNNANNYSEKLCNLAFHIISEDDITVFAHNQAVTTSEACMLYPTDVLSNDYIILSYNSDGTAYDNYLYISSTPSQFAIIATEDNTEVTITPSVPTFINKKKTQYVTMNKGQVYLVQALIDADNEKNDLSGSKVTTNKPVAIFTGQQRATVPIAASVGDNPSRDLLFEQLPPLRILGRNAFIVPFVQPKAVNKIYKDIFRIIVPYDNTEILINYKSIGTFNAGYLYEGNAELPQVINATNPILVGQYKKTATLSTDANAISDPFMLIVPPKEQFMNKYRVINTQAWEGNGGYSQKVYDEQYITIIAHKDDLANVKLDGVVVSTNQFLPIDTSYYYYTNQRVSDGVHTIESVGDVGVWVYGYGYANSYGYVGGMSFRPHDLNAPSLFSDIKCYKLYGKTFDTVALDSRIVEVTNDVSTNINTTVVIDAFQKYADSVSFSAELIDKFKDGAFDIAVLDSFGYRARDTFEIPGFTVNLRPILLNQDYPFVDTIIRINQKVCYPLIINNYGKFTQTITKANFKTTLPEYSIECDFPLTLKPGQSDTLYFCFITENEVELKDSLWIGNECIDRNVFSFKIMAVTDKNRPTLLEDHDPCYVDFDVYFTDSLISDFGIEKYEILLNENCNIKIINNIPKSVSFEIQVIDSDKDAIISIVVTDSVGNIREYKREIPGFTLSFAPELNTILDFGTNSIGTVICDSIEIYNYGKYTIELNNIYVDKNILFSIPQSQLPFKLLPEEKKSLEVCYHPLKVNKTPDTDSLAFNLKCITKKIGLEGNGSALTHNGNTKCEIPINIVVKEVPSNFFLEQSYPVPATDKATITFGIPNDCSVQLSVYNFTGTVVERLFFNDLKSGVYEIVLNTENYMQGAYFYEIKTESISLIKNMIIYR